MIPRETQDEFVEARELSDCLPWSRSSRAL